MVDRAPSRPIADNAALAELAEMAARAPRLNFSRARAKVLIDGMLRPVRRGSDQPVNPAFAKPHAGGGHG